MPVLSFPSLDAVPADFREHVTQAEDGSVKVDLVLRKKLDEFRDNNNKFQQERDAANQALGPLKEIVGDDIDGFKSELDNLRGMRGRVEAGELKESRQVDEAVARRTDDMRREHNEILQKQAKDTSAWKTRYEGLDSRYKQSLVVSAIKDAAMDPELGIDPRAMGHITTFALRTFKADDNGKLTPYEADGSSVLYGSSGDQMSPKEWLAKLRESDPFFFKSSQGGGAQGGGGQGGERKVGKTGYSAADLWKMDPKKRLSVLNGEKGARL